MIMPVLSLTIESRRRARFFVVSVLAYFTYFVVYRLGLGSIHIEVIIFLLAVLSGDLVNYLGNRYWVFRQRQMAWMRQGGRFFLVMLTTLLLQVGSFWLGTWLGIPSLMLVIALPFLRMVLNYVLHQAFTFSAPPSPPKQAELY